MVDILLGRNLYFLSQLHQSFRSYEHFIGSLLFAVEGDICDTIVVVFFWIVQLCLCNILMDSNSKVIMFNKKLSARPSLCQCFIK